MAVRLARQAILDRDDPPALWVVVDEGVLTREIGSPKTMADQLQHHLPWASGPPDRFHSIANWVDKLADADLNDYSGLGAAASYAVNTEFRGLERAPIGHAIERLPLPLQFRQLFRDWSNGSIDLVRIEDH